MTEYLKVVESVDSYGVENFKVSTRERLTEVIVLNAIGAKFYPPEKVKTSKS